MRDIFLTSATGDRLAATEDDHPSARGTAIILHGFNGHRNSENNRAVASLFHDLGYHTLRLDFYGRGESDGDYSALTVAKAVENARGAIGHVRRHRPDDKIMIVANSFGGLVALRVAIDDPTLAGLVLRAPASDWRAVWDAWLSDDDRARWRQTGWYERKGRQLSLDVLDEIEASNDLYAAISTITIPVLIVHGDADDIVPLAQSRRLHETLPDSELIVLNSVDHYFAAPQDQADYARHVRAFMARRYEALS